MPDLFGGLPYSTRDKIAEIERELALRRRVYPRFVADGKMSLDASQRQIGILEAVLVDYREMLAAARPAEAAA